MVALERACEFESHPAHKQSFVEPCKSVICKAFLFLFAVCSPLISACFRSFWRTNGEQKSVHKTQKMAITVTTKVSRNGQKRWYYFEWGKGFGERKASGIFTYVKPKDPIQKEYNHEALKLLESKKAQFTIEYNSIGVPYIPKHKFKGNFLDYYRDFVINNTRKGNRHLQGSLAMFSKFIRKVRITPHDVTENCCTRFRQYLLDNLTGKTPCDYFGAFKRVMRSATKDGYFRTNPAQDLRGKTNPSKALKDFLEADEFLKLLKTPVSNIEIRDAFIFCSYTGLRWCDVVNLRWNQIVGDKLVTTIIQRKTGKPVQIWLHKIAKQILDARRHNIQSQQPVTITNLRKRQNPLIFNLPTRNGANGVIETWVRDAKINKEITFSCARLMFSILLQDNNVDTATVAILLGHTTTRYVNEVYKRHRPKDLSANYGKLPDIEWNYQ